MQNEWKYAVKSADEIREKGLCGYYSMLKDGKDVYTNRTEKDFTDEGFTVLTDGEFHALLEEHERSICDQWKEITEEEYENALNILPPLKWCDGGFFMSEFYTGMITSFYQAFNGKYYTSLQSIDTPRSEIIKSLAQFVSDNN